MTDAIDFFRYLEEHAYPELTREQVAARELKERRQRAVDGGQWPITTADKAAIVAGTLVEHGPRSALAVARRWWGLDEANRGAFLLLFGEYGRGKTVAGCSLLADYGGYYVDAPELVRLRTSHNDKDTDKYDKILYARFVLLDDLGTEALDDKGFATFTQFVNRRQSGCKTLVTSNVNRETFVERYGERARARIEQVGHIVELNGSDMRKRAV